MNLDLICVIMIESQTHDYNVTGGVNIPSGEASFFKILCLGHFSTYFSSKPSSSVKFDTMCDVPFFPIFPVCFQCGTDQNPCNCKVVGPTLGKFGSL